MGSEGGCHQRQRRRPSVSPALLAPLFLLLLLAPLPLLSTGPSGAFAAKPLNPKLRLHQLRAAAAVIVHGNGSGSGGGDGGAAAVGRTIRSSAGSYEAPGTPEDLVACINDNQPDNNGTSWLSAMRDEHPFFKVVGMWWSSKPIDSPLTITTQLSWNRKWQLKAMCKSYAGPIAAVMHMPVLLPRLTGKQDSTLDDLTNHTLQRAVAKVSSFHAKLDALPCRMDLMLLAEPYRDGKSLVLYPVNLLRNYARLMARTPLIGLVDVDLIISGNLAKEMSDPTVARAYVVEAEAAVAAAAAGRRGPAYSTGLSRLASVESIAAPYNVTPKAGGRTAYVLPAFVTRGGSIGAQIARADKLVSLGKESLRDYYKRKQIQRFDPASSGHKYTEYSTWFESSSPYAVQWQERYEPWVIVDRLSSSWADSRFRGYGKNKIAQARTLAYEGYDLRVHPSAFLVHRPHLESSSSNAHSRGAMYSHKSKSSSMYGHNNYLYRTIQKEMAAGNYTPVVDPATAACRIKLSWWKGAPL